MENWKNGHQGMATWHILYDKDRDTLIEQSRIVLGQHMLITKDRDTLMEQSLCTKYSNRAVTHACKLEILYLLFTDSQQNRKISSKILSKIGKK